MGHPALIRWPRPRRKSGGNRSLLLSEPTARRFPSLITIDFHARKPTDSFDGAISPLSSFHRLLRVPFGSRLSEFSPQLERHGFPVIVYVSVFRQEMSRQIIHHPPRPPRSNAVFSPQRSLSGRFSGKFRRIEIRVPTVSQLSDCAKDFKIHYYGYLAVNWFCKNVLDNTVNRCRYAWTFEIRLPAIRTICNWNMNVRAR